MPTKQSQSLRSSTLRPKSGKRSCARKGRFAEDDLSQVDLSSPATSVLAHQQRVDWSICMKTRFVEFDTRLDLRPSHHPPSPSTICTILVVAEVTLGGGYRSPNNIRSPSDTLPKRCDVSAYQQRRQTPSSTFVPKRPQQAAHLGFPDRMIFL